MKFFNQELTKSVGMAWMYILIYIYIALHHVPSLQALDIYPGFNSPNKPWKCWWMVAKNKT